MRLADRLAFGFHPRVGCEGSGMHPDAPGGPYTAHAAEQRGGQGALQAVPAAAQHANGQTASWASSVCW